MKVKLHKEDVELGEPILWNVYSSQSMLLLKKAYAFIPQTGSINS